MILKKNPKFPQFSPVYTGGPPREFFKKFKKFRTKNFMYPPVSLVTPRGNL